MKKSLRIGGMMLIIICLLLLPMQSVMAEDIWDTEYQISYYRIPWGNGIDDDHDGVIDNIEETDVEYGNVAVNASDNVVDNTWYDEWKTPGGSNYFLDEGVIAAARYDELWEIQASYNASTNPDQRCYEQDDDLYHRGYDDANNDVINVVTFYINMTPSEIMNGAQKMWYRSPLAWETTVYQYHWLNIYNDDGLLVYASEEKANAPHYPYIVADNSTGTTDFKRIYYELSFNFRSGVKYRFEEYVKTIDDDPLNCVKVFMARAQDIGNDGEGDTYIFFGHDNTRKVEEECSWSMIFTIGIGPAGTEKPVFSGDDNEPEIHSNLIEGTDTIDNVKSIHWTFPLRTSTELDLNITLTVWSGPLDSMTYSKYIIEGIDVCGTGGMYMDIGDPNATYPNYYTIDVRIMNFDEGSGDVMVFTMYPDENATMILEHNGGDSWDESLHFAMHFEIVEFDDTLAGLGIADPLEISVDATGLLIGAGILTAGILAGWVVIPALFTSALVIGSAKVVGLAFAAYGSYMIASNVYQGGKSLVDIFAEGISRVLRGTFPGIMAILGGIADIIVRVVETIKSLGSGLLYYGGVILSAIVDIIYFLTAVAVWWLTAKFLSIMTHIRKGEIESAAKTIISVERPVKRRYREIARPIKKTTKKLIKRRR